MSDMTAVNEVVEFIDHMGCHPIDQMIMRDRLERPFTPEELAVAYGRFHAGTPPIPGLLDDDS